MVDSVCPSTARRLPWLRWSEARVDKVRAGEGVDCEGVARD